MENKRRLIDADLMALEESEAYMKVQTSGSVSPVTYGINSVVHRKIQELIASAPTVDAVEVETLRAWLYKIAMNNTKNYLCDACEEIISRLDGLRAFARERKEDVNA